MNELAWIDFLKKRVPHSRDVFVGIGDDCALVKIGKEKILLKSDVFIEDIHFKRGKSDFKTIGMRATARVLSDFAACAGIPKFIGASIGIPSYIKDKALKEILSGILINAKKYNFSLVGGDTSKAEKLFLDIWGVGITKKCILRSTAKEGDYIFITGRLGRRKFSQSFEPRLKEAQFLVERFKVNAMIDISDGFIIDLYRIMQASKKGALLYEENIPVTKRTSDLYRGEDYELIFTIDKKEQRVDLLKQKFYFVGEIKSLDFGYKIKRNSRLLPMKIKGYLHF